MDYEQLARAIHAGRVDQPNRRPTNPDADNGPPTGWSPIPAGTRKQQRRRNHTYMT